jgi:tRNA modification GTPase
LVVTVVSDFRLEIHSHGGAISSKIIAQNLRDAGATEIDPMEFLLIDSEDRWQYELQQSLIRCETEAAALNVLEQQTIWAHVVPLWLEAIHQRNGEWVLQEIDKTLLRYHTARHWIKPWKVVLCGPPNVGKSSLINALVGFERAIVSDLPGTTRDVLRQRTVIGGWPIQLSDTAGLRTVDDPLEATAIARGIEAMESADCVIDVAAWDNAGRMARAERVVQTSDLLVCNKADLLPELSLEDGTVLDEAHTKRLAVSAKTGQQIDRLLREILDRLVPQPLPKNVPCPVTDSMYDRLIQAQQCLLARDFEKAVTIVAAKGCQGGGDG